MKRCIPVANKFTGQALTATFLTGKVKTNRPGPATEDKYGYGFGDRKINGARIVGHNGGRPGYQAQLDIYPDKGCVVVVLANQDRAAMPTIQRSEEILTR